MAYGSPENDEYTANVDGRDVIGHFAIGVTLAAPNKGDMKFGEQGRQDLSIKRSSEC